MNVAVIVSPVSFIGIVKNVLLGLMKFTISFTTKIKG